VALARRSLAIAVGTDGDRAAVAAAVDGEHIVWTAGGTDLVQTWDTEGMQVTAAITLECFDITAKCTRKRRKVADN